MRTAAVAARADILCTDNTKDFPHEAMEAVGIELLTADASTVAALRGANATKTADLVAQFLDL